MGIEILTKNTIESCRELGNFDTKTSSWVKTPSDIRKLAAPSFVIAATTLFSCTTTVRNLTMPLGRSVAR